MSVLITEIKMANEIGSHAILIGGIATVSYLFDKYDPQAIDNAKNIYAALIAGTSTVVGTKTGSYIAAHVASELGLVPKSTYDAYTKTNFDKAAFLVVAAAGVAAGGYAGYQGSKWVSDKVLDEPQNKKEITLSEARENFIDPKTFQPKSNQAVFKY
jgi:hypothetical protein